MACGFQFDRYDLDYLACDAQMRLLGHPGIPKFREWYLDACFDQRPSHCRRMEKPEYTQRLLDAVPALADESEPLPFAFPPIAYRLQQYISKETFHVVPIPLLPAVENIYDRLSQTAKRDKSDLTNNSNGAYEPMSRHHDFDRREASWRRKRDRHIRAQQELMAPGAPLALTSSGEGNASSYSEDVVVPTADDLLGAEAGEEENDREEAARIKKRRRVLAVQPPEQVAAVTGTDIVRAEELDAMDIL